MDTPDSVDANLARLRSRSSRWARLPQAATASARAGLVSLLMLAATAGMPTLAHAAVGSWGAAGQAQSPPIGDGRSSVVVALQAPGSVMALYDDGAKRTFAVPSGCVPAALSAASVALQCSAAGLSPVQVLNMARGTVQVIPITDTKAAVQLRIAAMGSRWIRAVRYETNPNNPGVGLSTVLVNRASGALRSQATSLARSHLEAERARYLDLDQSSPQRALCSPVQRLDGADFLLDSQDAFGPLRKLGQWTVAEGQDPGDEDSELYQLQRCGSHVVTVHSTSPIEISRSRAAYRTGLEIRLRDLTGKSALHRYRRPASVAGQKTTIALSAGRLWLSAGNGSPLTLFSIRLRKIH